MRALRRLVLPAALMVLGCQKGGPRICPEGTQTVRAVEGKEVWCRDRDGGLMWIQLYEGISRRQSCTYRKDGDAHGPFTAWHQNGSVWLQGEYRDGKRNGKWRQWDKDGMKVAEGEYRLGDFVAGAPVGLPALCEKQKL